MLTPHRQPKLYSWTPNGNVPAVYISPPPAATQVWHGFVDTIRLLPSVPSASRPVIETLGEKRTLDDAIEKLQLLISLRKGELIPSASLAGPEPVVISTPLLPTSGDKKRKRKSSFSSSPVPQVLHTGASLESAMSSVPSPLPRAGTPGSRELTGKQRKELFLDQLPLQPGRKVAFKLPTKDTSGADDEWILAHIRKCIQGDKMRYEVQDADDASTTYNTTLRSIIPLPDPTSPPTSSAHPSNLEDYPKGFQVLGLYPDTTALYRATVVSPPLPGTGMGLGIRGDKLGAKPEPGAKREMYRLAFIDDNDNIHEVHKDLVVPVSSVTPGLSPYSQGTELTR